MANFTCDLNTLLADAKCFLEVCLGEADREAIEIYLRVQNLKASGGADYTTNLNALLQDSRQWQVLACNQRKAISLWIDMQNALDNGASFSQNVNDLKKGANCYACLGHELKKNVLEFLKCSINTLGKPD